MRVSRLTYRKKEFFQRTTINHRKKFSVKFSGAELSKRFEHQNGCLICGVELAFIKDDRKKGPIPNSPSLDRISNGHILTLRNVQLICHQCNSTKGARTMKKFIEYCSMVAKKYA